MSKTDGWIKHSGDNKSSETWDEGKDKEVQGVFQEKKELEVKGKLSNLYLLEKLDGTLVGVWGSHILDREFQDGVELGDEVKIVFLGKVDIGGGKSLKKYDFYHKKADETPSL